MPESQYAKQTARPATTFDSHEDQTSHRAESLFGHCAIPEDEDVRKALATVSVTVASDKEGAKS